MTVQYTGKDFPGMFYLTLGTGLLVAALCGRGWGLWELRPQSDQHRTAAGARA